MVLDSEDFFLGVEEFLFERETTVLDLLAEEFLVLEFGSERVIGALEPGNGLLLFVYFLGKFFHLLLIKIK